MHCNKLLDAGVVSDATATAARGRQLLVGPRDVSAQLGDTVLLECAANNYTPTSLITWTRHGQCQLKYYCV